MPRLLMALKGEPKPTEQVGTSVIEDDFESVICLNSPIYDLEKGSVKKLLQRSLSTLAPILLISALFTVLPSFAQTPRIYVNPSAINYSTSTTNLGDKFNVTIWVENSPPVGAWQVYMEFNDSVINATRWFEPTWDPSYMFYTKTTSAMPTPPTPMYRHISAGKGSVMVAASLFPPPPTQQPSSGTKKLCILEFMVAALPPKLGNLTSVLGIDQPYTYLLDPDGFEVSPCTKEDGSYSFAWDPPASPHMGIYPHSIFFDPYGSAVGQKFNVSLYVKSLSELWYMTTVSFDLAYDAYVVDVVDHEADVAVDGLWGAPSVSQAYGRLSISVGSPSTNPSGDVLVAVVTFTVMCQNHWPDGDLVAYLTFENVLLYDHVGAVPTGASESCLVEVPALLSTTFRHTLTIGASFGGTTLPSPGSREYDEGSLVSVEAVPDPGFVLVHWHLDGINAGNDNPFVVTMDQNHSLYAEFVSQLGRNLAVLNLTCVRAIVGWNCVVNATVTIANQGGYTETFNVTFYAGATAIDQIQLWLPAESTVVVLMVWNTSGFARGNYTMSVCAGPVPEESRTDDNFMADGVICVANPGDVNGDGKVDVRDLYAVARAYGSSEGQPNWNPACDINSDGKVDTRDYYITCRNYGKT